MIFGIPAIITPGTVFSIQITDDLGHEIVLREPARRIIPLYGAFAEMLFAIGAGKEVVARTQADQFPPGIINLPSVGTHMRPNVEMIIGLKPDLVVMDTVMIERGYKCVAQMERAGLPLLFLDLSHDPFRGPQQRLRLLGKALGREERAEAVARLLCTTEQTVRSTKHKALERLRAYYGGKPP
jgi:iron complex transport system substrate-binding protein